MHTNTRPKGHYTGPISLKWCEYSNTVRAMPANYLAADLSHIDASLWGREGEIGHLMAAAPAMLAALQTCLANAIARRDAAKVYADKAGNPSKADVQAEIDEIRAVIAAATGEPSGNQSPVAIAQPDESWPGDLATYRITETVSYLVKAEDEAHAESRFVCEAGIQAECFHAVESRTIEREEGEDD